MDTIILSEEIGGTGNALFGCTFSSLDHDCFDIFHETVFERKEIVLGTTFLKRGLWVCFCSQ